MADDESFLRALDSCDCEAAREALFAWIVATTSPAEREAMAQEMKSRRFDRALSNDVPRAFTVARAIEQLGYAAHQPVIIALGLLARGDAERQSGQALTAMDLHRRAGDLFARHGDRVGWARAQGGWLVAATHAGRITPADLDVMAEARQVLADAEQTYRLIVLEQNIGLAYQYLGQYREAVVVFDRALAQVTPDMALLHAMLLANRGNAVLMLGDVLAAQKLKLEARAILLAINAEGPVAIEEIHLAQIAQIRWHHREALQMISSAIKRFEHAHYVSSLALAFIFRADILCTLNRFEDALDDVGHAIAHLRQLQMLPDLAFALHMQARIANALRQDTLALLCLQESEQLIATTHSPREALFVRTERLAMLQSMGKNVEVRDAVLAMLGTPLLAEAKIHETMAMMITAEATLALGDLQQAGTMARTVLKRAQEKHMPEMSVRAALTLARVALAKGRRREALAWYDRAFAYMRATLDEMVLDQRAHFLENRDSFFLEALHVALESGEMARALGYLERARTQVEWQAVPPETPAARQIADLRRRHRALSASLLTLPANSPAAGQASNEMRRVTSQLRDLMEAQASIRDVVPEEAGDPLAHVPREHTILEYALLEEDLVIFAISSGEIHAEVVPQGATQIRRMTRTLRLAIDTLGERLSGTEATQIAGEMARWDGAIQQTLARLWHVLIQPVERWLPPDGESLGLIPHGEMHSLPLAALFDGSRYLIERWQPKIAHSLHALGAGTSNLAMATGPALALGYSDHDTLPHAPDEARHVAALLGGEAWVEEKASGEALLAAQRHPSIFHVASHGAVRLDLPYASFVQLADGPFHPTDVLEMDLRGCRLVTLSACQTGLGRPSGGNEQIGLARAFGLAGAEAVLATLWRVDDATTDIFMDACYRAIAAGASPAAATRQAQLALLGDVAHPFHARPAFWAGFQLVLQRAATPMPPARVLARPARARK
jgi:tetratricopeptide (TPR) repeat protein